MNINGFRKDLKEAFISTLPVLSGYLFLGMGFGVLLRLKGYSFIWAFFMSITMYAGSMQYVAVDLLAGGASILTTAVTTLMVQARHLFYGVSLIDKYRGAGIKKSYMMFGLTDETYSLVCSDKTDEPKKRHRYYFLVTLLDHTYWISGCTLGALLGAIIKFDVTGIDFVLTALFITIFVEQWLSTRDHLPAIIGVVASVICLVIFGSESFLIPAMLVITLALTLIRKREETRNDN